MNFETGFWDKKLYAFGGPSTGKEATEQVKEKESGISGVYLAIVAVAWLLIIAGALLVTRKKLKGRLKG